MVGSLRRMYEVAANLLIAHRQESSFYPELQLGWYDMTPTDCDLPW